MHPNVQVRPDIPVPAALRRGARAHAGVFAPLMGTERWRHRAKGKSECCPPSVASGQRSRRPRRDDRSSTGYLPAREFERLADAFFAEPHRSVRGWERAVDAQARVVGAATKISAATQGLAAVAIISHGAVGTLLYCHLLQQPISRRFDQPPNGGGNYFSYSLSPPTHTVGGVPLMSVSSNPLHRADVLGRLSLLPAAADVER